MELYVDSNFISQKGLEFLIQNCKKSMNSNFILFLHGNKNCDQFVLNFEKERNVRTHAHFYV